LSRFFKPARQFASLSANLKQFQSSAQEFLTRLLRLALTGNKKKQGKTKNGNYQRKKRRAGKKKIILCFARRCRFFSYSFAAFNSLLHTLDRTADSVRGFFSNRFSA
jgi:hypothetical protein